MKTQVERFICIQQTSKNFYKFNQNGKIQSTSKESFCVSHADDEILREKIKVEFFVVFHTDTIHKLKSFDCEKCFRFDPSSN